MSTDLSASPVVLPPPGRELEQLIAFISPPGALVWETLPVEVPWTRPPSGSERQPSQRQLDGALRSAGVTHPDARWYIVNGPRTDIMVGLPRDQAQKIGHPARSIEVAAEHDITGADLMDLSERLGLTDQHHSADTRGARRYLSRGRKILASVGVWPWAHVSRWHPQQTWWTQEDVIVALLRWHDHWWMDAAKRLAGSARARNGQPLLRALTVTEFEACWAFRESLRGDGAGRG